MRLRDIPNGALIYWAGTGTWWRVNEVRRHARTEDDNTAWLFLDGWKTNPPLVDLDTVIPVQQTFS